MPGHGRLFRTGRPYGSACPGLPSDEFRRDEMREVSHRRPDGSGRVPTAARWACQVVDAIVAVTGAELASVERAWATARTSGSDPISSNPLRRVLVRDEGGGHGVGRRTSGDEGRVG